jgi:hypothetical protein
MRSKFDYCESFLDLCFASRYRESQLYQANCLERKDYEEFLFNFAISVSHGHLCAKSAVSVIAGCAPIIDSPPIQSSPLGSPHGR